MALLARRRSHQAVAEANSEKAHYKHAFPPVPGIPDDFDPRIRGKVVHDFSAPRPGSNKASTRERESERQREAILYNSRRPSPNPTTSSADDDSPSSGERDHTPQFKEHFDDDLDPLQDGPAKQGTSAFMYQVSLSDPQPNPDRSVLPPFARHLPSKIISVPNAVQESKSLPPNKPLEIVPEASTTDVVLLDKSLPSTPSTSPPVKVRSRASSSTDSPYQPAGLPKHFKSNASRFSFDMTGVGSATQEQILEEKHRQNEKKKARRSDNRHHSAVGTAARDADDDEEDFDEYNDLDHNDGLEERIPGVNADPDEPTMLDSQYHMQHGEFTSPHKSSFTSDPSIASTGLTSPNTPRDSMGQPVDLAMTQASLGLSFTYQSNEPPYDRSDRLTSSKGEFDHAAHAHPATDLKSGRGGPQLSVEPNEEDDMYFDDGVIDDLDKQEGQVFDESVFDDDTSRIYGLALRDLEPLPGETATANEKLELNGVGSTDSGAESRIEGSRLCKNTSTESRKSLEQPTQDASTSFSQITNMTDHMAYQDALVAGVNQAALTGKFTRAASLRPGVEFSFDNNTGMSQAVIPENGINDKGPRGLLIGAGTEDTDDFDFDDALADDPIIAAANAEALENDDEGFYGQEFGFFARASGSGEAEYVNGGYFGSRASEGIGRSHSGRVNEPSLTPITERSERSNRNSAYPLQCTASSLTQPAHNPALG